MTGKMISRYRSLPVQARASFWFLVCSFLQKAVSVITTPIFTRIMPAADYGRFGVFNSWCGMFAIVVTLSLTGGVHMQGLVKFEDQRAGFTSSLLGLTTVLVGGWTVLYVLFRDGWNQLLSLSTVQMVSMLLIIWATAVYEFWANERIVDYSYRKLLLATVAASVAKPVLEIVLVTHSEDKATARILGWAAADLLAYSWMFVRMMRSGRVFVSGRFWKYALAFNLPLVPHYLSLTVLNSADRIMIQKLVGSGEAGIYNLAYSVALIMTLFNTALGRAVSPWMYRKIKDRRVKDIAPVAYTTLLIVAAANLILILMAPEVVAVFAPPSYSEAVWIIPPVAMSVFFIYVYGLFAEFSFYYEKTAAMMGISISGAMLNILFNAVFIPRFGYMAAGYTTLACYMLYAAAHYLLMRKICREHCGSVYPFGTGRLLAITVPFLSAGFLLLATYRHPVLRYSLAACAAFLGICFRKRIAEAVKGIFTPEKYTASARF